MAQSASDAFTTALDKFKKQHSPSQIASFKAVSLTDIEELIDQLQKAQNKRKAMQNMARLKPFIDGLRGFSSVIEVFVQAKPEILALIWVKHLDPNDNTGFFIDTGLINVQGPLKLLLQVSQTRKHRIFLLWQYNVYEIRLHPPSRNILKNYLMLLKRLERHCLCLPSTKGYFQLTLKSSVGFLLSMVIFSNFMTELLSFLGSDVSILVRSCFSL